MAGGPDHTALTQAVGMNTMRDFAAMVRTEIAAIDERTESYE